MADPISLTPEQLEALKTQVIEELMSPVDLEPIRGFDDGTYVVVCHTPGCDGEGEQHVCEFVGIYDVQCGGCGNEITDVQEVP